MLTVLGIPPGFGLIALDCCDVLSVISESWTPGFDLL
jgi:hypothetical protein